MPDIQRIDIAEFRREGYLQELNRRFLHPLGLALEVARDKQTGEEQLGGVWDYRADPEGIYFAGELLEDLAGKADHVDQLWREREPARRDALGYMVQPPADTSSYARTGDAEAEQPAIEAPPEDAAAADQSPASEEGHTTSEGGAAAAVPPEHSGSTS